MLGHRVRLLASDGWTLASELRAAAGLAATGIQITVSALSPAAAPPGIPAPSPEDGNPAEPRSRRGPPSCS